MSIQPIMDKLIGVEDPDDLMVEILDALPQTANPTEVTAGTYCTFVYSPKTFLVRYDQNPLVAVTEVFEWGFRGINYHWGAFRNYTWEEFVGDVHIVSPSDLAALRTIPYQKFRLNI